LDEFEGQHAIVVKRYVLSPKDRAMVAINDS